MPCPAHLSQEEGGGYWRRDPGKGWVGLLRVVPTPGQSTPGQSRQVESWRAETLSGAATGARHGQELGRSGTCPPPPRPALLRGALDEPPSHLLPEGELAPSS